MRSTLATQSLSYPIRLPAVLQAEALRLLDVWREGIMEPVNGAAKLSKWAAFYVGKLRVSSSSPWSFPGLRKACCCPKQRNTRRERTAKRSKQPWLRYAKRTAMGALPWNSKASSNRRAISTSKTAAFPRPIRDMQAIAVLKAGMLPYACLRWR